MSVVRTAWGFRVPRVTLVASVLTPISPPQTAKCVSIGNATTGDLQVHTRLDESEYLVNALFGMSAVPSGSFRVVIASETANSPVTVQKGSFLRWRTMP